MKNIPVEKNNWSKETQARDLVSADIGLAPLPDNRFTRGKCGFKILQYAAARLPVIASPVGVNRELVEEGETGFLATDNQQWKQSLNKLINSGELRKEAGKKNREFAKQFDLDAIGKKLVDIIKND
jgi:glycosyltransferase involved in cell wall biosynthesis